MFRKLRLSVFVLMVLLVTAFAYAQDKAPKHIFMFIGDGMGVAQRQIAELQLNNKPGVTATSQKVRLNMNSLKVLGMNTTYDSTSIVPDSASTATSLASGYKTLSGVIGMKEDKVTKVPLISEFLKQKGLSVGIISDVKIVHATPAAFYAHIDSRNKYDEIASQLIHSGFDLFVGGGGDKHFNPATREDGKDLYAEAASKGFALARTRDEFLSLKKGTKVLANLPGDVYDEALPYVMDRTGADLNLDEIVSKSIDLLSGNPKGFFMVVEGGKIDWACHANDTGAAIVNMLDLDKAIGVALTFKEKNPDALIIVTGDHECGGLGLSMGNTYRVNPELFYSQKISHEVVDEQIKTLAGKKELTEEAVFRLAEEFGLASLTEAEKTAIVKSIADERTGDKDLIKTLYGGYRPVSMVFKRLFNTRANLYWTSYSHTGIPVMLTAEGPGADRFAGYIDNTDVCRILNTVAQAEMKW